MGKVALIRKKATFVILVFFSLTVIYAFYIILIEKYSKGNIKCFFTQSGNALLELNETEPTLGRDIFFHETSCPGNIDDVRFSFRQACSIESALLAHPKKGELFFSFVKDRLTDKRSEKLVSLLSIEYNESECCQVK